MEVLQPHTANCVVWAVPRSLAATEGISLISLPQGTEMLHFPWLALYPYSVQDRVPHLQCGGLSHSEIVGSLPTRRLADAYRSLSRPSSPPTAKASATCPYELARVLHSIHISMTKPNPHLRGRELTHGRRV